MASVGDNCVDRYQGQLQLELAGGNALNVAAGLAASGLDSHYLGAVGHDDDGELILASARAGDVDMSKVRRLELPTGVTIVALGPDGDREFLEERHGASRAYRPDAADVAFLRGCAWVHCVNLDDPEPLVRELDGVRLSYDFGTDGVDGLAERLAPGIEIAFFSAAGQDRERAVELGRRAVGAGSGMAVVTRGRSGSLAIGRAVHEVAAVPVEVVDTLGAGDALISGVIAARLAGLDAEAALAAGAAAAARTCTHFGAWQPGEGAAA